jgi:hypothetical protein
MQTLSILTLLSPSAIIGIVIISFCLLGIYSSIRLIPDNEGHELDEESVDVTDYSRHDKDELTYGGRL